MSLSDEQCVRACLNDHPEAFRHLVERYQCPLTQHLHGQLGDPNAATEAAQEAFVRAYFALRQLRKPEAFFPWLVGIADRVVKETRRAVKRRREVNCQPIESAEPAGQPVAPAEIAVSEAVARLSDVYREVVLLRYYGGCSCAEIAGSLGIPLGTVTKRLSRAYALLRAILPAQSQVQENEVSP
jgi:RNA polymerase sigma-70 factor (ECF subfamily)